MWSLCNLPAGNKFYKPTSSIMSAEKIGEKIDEYRALFKTADKDGSGHVSKKELIDALKLKGNIGESLVNKFVKAVDKDGDRVQRCNGRFLNCLNVRLHRRGDCRNIQCGRMLG